MNNSQDFLKQLEQLNHNDRQEIETFIGYLKSRPKQDSLNLVQKANNELLKDYVELTIDYTDFDATNDEIEIYFTGRDRPVSFDAEWFVYDDDNNIDFKFNEDIFNKFETLHVKYRPGSNRIDKVAIDAKYLTELGKKEGKKRILVLEQIKNVEVPLTAAGINTISNSVVIPCTGVVMGSVKYRPLDGNLITASASKKHSIFNAIQNFTEDRMRLDRVALIMVNFINTLGPNTFSWDSEFYYAQTHDFTVISGNVLKNKTIKVKAHFRANDCLQISEFSLKNINADVILSVLVEETDTEYKATICGYISKTDFVSNTKPWKYNEKIVLRSMELSELSDAKVLFE